MSDKLKKYVSESREQFDSHEPSAELWNKIDARMNLKNSTRLNRNWLSKYKFIAFSASVLVIILFFTTPALRTIFDKSALTNKKEIDKIKEVTKPNDEKNLNSKEPLVASDKSASSSFHFSNNTKRDHSPHTNHSQNSANSFSNTSASSASTLADEKNKVDTSNYLENEEPKPNLNSLSKQKENTIPKNKKPKLYIPPEPSESDLYTGTLYEGPSFRAMLRAYKFPGKFNIDEGGTKTISCSHLEKIPNIKAIWLKGKTDKELFITIKRKFKNVILVKKDGRQIKPEAISHYYRGLGVISEFRGKAFNMLFKDKVQLILFFKNAEAGDKIIIDGTFKAVVQDQP